MRSVLLVALVLLAAGAGAAAAADSCRDCHGMLDDPRLSAPAKRYAADIHARRGIGCAGCHGGDPDDQADTAMDPERGFRGSMARGDIAEMCASCHANAAFMKRYNPRPYIFSVAEYRTSVHCKLEELGDRKVATCTDCHGVHGILPHTDPASPVFARNVPATCAKCHNPDYLEGRRVPSDQFERYRGSVHGVALLEKGDASAPACNDCHGNHGAAPPGLRDVSMVCGSCHGRVAELFNASRMKAGMDRAGKHGCVTCHGNHDVQRTGDEMLAVAAPGLCGGCHEPGSESEKGTLAIVDGFHGLKRDVTRADSLLAAADRLGMETTAARAMLREAGDQVIGARAALHSFDPVKVGSVIGEGRQLAARAAASAESAMRDWHMRRVGLGLSLGVIVLVIGLLVVKIRTLEAD